MLKYSSVKHRRKWLAVAAIPLILVIILALIFLKFMNPIFSFDSTKVPSITDNPVQLDQIFAISYFRSNAGHDYSYGAWDGETCRSMKHYFNFSQSQQNGRPLRSTPGPGESNINIYAPFDGKIIANRSEHTPIGTQVHIASNQNLSYYVRLFHIDLLPSLKVGDKVKSGQLVGTIGPKDGMDVSYEANYKFGKVVYLSIFDRMTTRAFAPYAKLGFRPGDFVLSRQGADAKGYQCNGEQFVNNGQGVDARGIPYGYIPLRPNPYAGLYQQQGR